MTHSVRISRKRAAQAALSTLLLTAHTPVSLGQQAPAHEYKPDGYHIETVPTPEDVRFHVTGLDSDKKGAIWVATRLGEVWRLQHDKWSLFASGLHEPTGLLVDDDGSIVVAQKPELTRLTDEDGDGKADQFSTLADDWTFHDNYHEFTFGPTKDKAGNYFGTLNLSHNHPQAFTMGAMGSPGGFRGFAFSVSDKGEFTPYAWGLRSPAGIGTSPEGEVFFTDNQGDWVPTSKMHLLEKNKFYGHPVSLIDVEGYTEASIKAKSLAEFEAMSEKPVVWIPHVEVANSPGNPTWNTTKGKFGPFEGQIFIGDQTQSNIFRVILDKVNGHYQGAVINFMNRFQSGNVRTVFDNQGQLWVGQTARGWGAQGPKPFGLQKVVWDGTTPFELKNIQLTKKGYRLSFTSPLAPASVDISSFAVQQWHYRYSGDYGSPKMALESVPVTKVSAIDDYTLDIEMPLTKDKVVQITFDGLQDKEKRNPSVNTVYYTLNYTK